MLSHSVGKNFSNKRLVDISLNFKYFWAKIEQKCQVYLIKIFCTYVKKKTAW